MKSTALPLIIAFLVLAAAGAIVSWAFFHRDRQLQLVDIPPSYLSSVDTSRFSVQPLVLTREFPDDSVLLIFPANTSLQHIFVYDQKNYNRLLFGDHHGMPLFFADAEGLSAMKGKPVINLSDHPGGKYFIHVTSCNFGGFLQIELEDMGSGDDASAK
ncbi:MAG TPA: hypothetical protein VFU15_00020 [Bacteroidia bacterium]|nr:hypothetical protein [Bacteroidia bacterium]